MGICSMCGCYIDPGEPGCPECGFVGARSTVEEVKDEDKLDFSSFDDDDLIDVLEEHGYDLDDFEMGLIPDWEVEEIYDELG